MRSILSTLIYLRLTPIILALSPPIPETQWTEVEEHPFPDAPNALSVPDLSSRSRSRSTTHLPPLPIYQHVQIRTSKRVIIGKEDRHLLNPDQLTSYPTIAIGRLVSTRPGPNNTAITSLCTGSLIGPRHVATAAHCIHPEYPGMKIRFEPGFDQVQKANASFVERYYREDTSKFEGNLGCGKYVDIAILILTDRIGDKVGWLNVKKVEKGKGKDMRFTQQGYPRDLYKGMRPMRQENIKVTMISPCGEDPLWTDADAAGGMSGGPLWAEGVGAMGGRVWYQYGILSSGFKADDEWVAAFAAGQSFVDMAKRAMRDFP